ncbi:conjugal transfer protein TraL [Chromobacterium piscinae]|uniref:nucleotide-binding protein n=1 Tax=Chromobacterium piscinae TaxID=686831 RepID=UPI001E60FFE2|nr:conjugal transfer protein TraL [Chromobacterium piscinae]MCD4505550.1 conjugal transfer protein TraL [Chromobacterium piscinae]
MNTHTRTAHIVTNGKGGIGKSKAASDLAQALRHLQGQVTAYDTDAVNRTLSRTRALNATAIELLDDGMQINPRNFDTLMARLIDSETDAVIDVGSNGFLPLMHYLSTSGAVEFLAMNGVRVRLHIIVAGGDELTDTSTGLATMMRLVDAPAVVWLNEHFGPVVKNGKTFEESTIYQEFAPRIYGIITMPRLDPATTGRDLAEMKELGLTYEEAMTHHQFAGMPGFRILRAWNQILDSVAASTMETINA